ncbi:MAG: pilus assembly protein PilM, partial [Candidatus Omnitrophota bacterium]
LKLTPGDKVNEVTQAFGSSIDNLAEEVRVSFDYFMTEKKFPVTELFLVGGGALYKGVDAMFQKSLNIPVKIWNPLEVLRLGAQVSPTEIGAVSSQLTAAIGLAFTKI